MILDAVFWPLVLTLGAGPSPETYRVFELASPSVPGLYRFRLSDEMAEMWKLQSRLQVFDAAGSRLPCELAGSLPLQGIRNTYTLHGKWLADEVAWSLPMVGKFPFNGVWRFDVPQTKEGESRAWFRFSWRSTINDVGEVQLVTGPDDRPTKRGRLQQGLLRAGDTFGNFTFNLGDQYLYPPMQWSPVAELHFSLASGEIEIDAAALETWTIRPWFKELPREPGWYVFYGNGKTPYRVQTGLNVEFCSGLAAGRDSNNPDLNWPPEATVSRQVVGSLRLGKSSR